MLKSKSKWILKDHNPIHQIDFDLSVSDITKKLLVQRGIKDPESARKFLSPSLEDLHDPFEFEDMNQAVNRIHQAIRQEENILIFGDYDADGVTATSILMETLTDLGAHADFYIPNRFTEGYGPNQEAFYHAKKQGFSLIITVDTGIAAVTEAKLAKQLGMDLIITDHHEAQETIPDAFAIIHPKRSARYPFPELSGAGVAFKLAHALYGELPAHLLEYVAIGTVADLVPLQDENRILVYHGLKSLTYSKKPGIQALKQVCGIKENINEVHIGFALGPRINAVGRLQDASLAVELLLEEDPSLALEMAEKVQELNQKRQQMVTQMTHEAKQMITDENFEDDYVLVLAKEGWNTGVLGIVASRLTQEYNRPAVLLGIDPEAREAKGSARSIDAFDLFENCMEIKDVFINFGGHAQAAGMTVAVEKIESLRSSLNRLAKQKLTEDDFKPVLYPEFIIDIEDLNFEAIEEINRLAPFGVGNPRPVFQMNDMMPGEIRQIGSNSSHLKIHFQKGDKQLDAVGFGMGDLFPHLSSRAPISVVGELDINEWNGHKKMQVVLKDLKVDQWQLFDYRGVKHLSRMLDGLENEDIYALIFESVPPGLDWVEECFPVKDASEFIAMSGHVYDWPDGLLLLDLPSSLNELSQVFRHVKPKKIFACFQSTGQHFFSRLPDRNDFKWLYAFLLKKKRVPIPEGLQQIRRIKGWTTDWIEFMIKVFLELEFVTMDDGVLSILPSPAKKDLNEAEVYREKLRQIEIEKTLFYSSYKDLREWFDQQMNDVRNAKEEIVYGL